VIREQRPDLQILTCHDEYLLHTAFDVDGTFVGYGNVAPELLLEMIDAGKAKDYKRARCPRQAAACYKEHPPPRLTHGG
jgi:4-hydroxy-tetrahydrodipicolinate synthase